MGHDWENEGHDEDTKIQIVLTGSQHMDSPFIVMRLRRGADAAGVHVDELRCQNNL